MVSAELMPLEWAAIAVSVVSLLVNAVSCALIVLAERRSS